MRRLAWVTCLGILGGCKSPEPAPEDLDGLFQWFWENSDTASDDEVRAAIVNLHAVVDGDALSDPVRGTMSRLDAADAALVGVELDPANAAGFHLVGPIGCTISGLEPILYHLAQEELYEGVYDAYSRSYRTPLEPYLSREVPTVSWDVDIEASLLGDAYTETLIGGLRYIPEEDGVGPALIQRTYMPEPAVFEDENKVWPLDFQIEVYYPRASGDLVHLYGIWREMALGSITTEDAIFQQTVLSNLEDWDEGTTQLCEEDRP